jgi:glycyl-tRNA synthetase
MANQTNMMERIVALCKRRGFIFGSSEIYGGIGGFWDYGPLGTELKRNIEHAWWNDMVQKPPPGPNGLEHQMVGLDCSIIMNRKIWEASGHVAEFSHPMVDCKVCKARFQAHRLQARQCPECGEIGQITESREFNLMFQTHVGALQDSTSLVYLRPETAQGIFANFKNVLDSTRIKLPFGIAQIGKSFRNEINPRNYTFRSREFEQYEIEFFCHESEAAMWYEYWREVRHRWYVDLGLTSEKLRLREHEADELAHYAKSCADVEYDFPFGMSELEGIANRTDYDLKAHIEKSGKDLTYFDDQRKERYVPYVIEPSGGVDRSVLAFITEAYTVDENRASPEFMNFHPRLAPIKAAVFPLVAKDGMPDIAEPIYREIKRHFPCQYDAKQSIGRRYARMDEAGTPFCFTIDGKSKEDGTVTVRNRNDATQIRINESRCVEYLHDQFHL